MNRSVSLGVLLAALLPAAGVSAPATQSKATALTALEPVTTVPLRFSIANKTSVPKPVACELEEAAKAEHVLIRIGRVGNDLVAVPATCKVAADAVVTWVPDTTLNDLEIRFVKPGADNLCANATKGDTPDAGSNTVFSPPTGAGPVLPISFTVSDKPPAGSSFKYCVSAGGGNVTPNPAIIIKPD